MSPWKADQCETRAVMSTPSSLAARLQTLMPRYAVGSSRTAAWPALGGLKMGVITTSAPYALSNSIFSLLTLSGITKIDL